MNPMPKTTSFVVVGDKTSASVNNIIDAKEYIVVGYRWVLECIARDRYDLPTMQHVSERGGGEREVGKSNFCGGRVAKSTQFARCGVVFNVKSSRWWVAPPVGVCTDDSLPQNG